MTSQEQAKGGELGWAIALAAAAFILGATVEFPDNPSEA